jgi:hypothetical protein
MRWLSSSVWGREPQTARYQQLRAEIIASGIGSGGGPESEHLAAIVGASASELPTWDAMLQAEVVLVRQLAPEALRLKHANLKDEYTALAGPAQANSYLARLSDPVGCGTEQVRAEVVDLLAHVQRLRTLRHGFNLIRTTVTLIATLLALLFCSFIIFYFVRATQSGQSWTPFATTMLALSGMLGGCISALSRLYQVGWNQDLVTGTENFSHLFWSLVLNFIVSILVGGVFAILLYLAFMGNLVSGSLFPRFKAEPVQGLDLFHHFVESGPLTHGDYAKAVVWGFLAGFSERVVPDFLTTLGSRLTLGSRS